jgi:ketosteroid isomerase-like protein
MNPLKLVSTMRKVLTVAGAMLLLLKGINVTAAEPRTISTELDAFWSEVARTVAEGDFAGYAATYHPDAVLVNGASDTSYPIASALQGWEQGFIDTREGKMEASVEFRFTRRQNDETTAHETGIFHYSANPAEGNASDQLIHFEALLVKKDGWKMVMEYQKTPATPEEWAAAGQ